MKPIIFSTPMVQAILDGRKTMTRRVIKPQTVTHNTTDGQRVESLDEFFGRNAKDMEMICAASSPYQPGDVLWVRETFFQENCAPDCAGRTDEDECPFKRVDDKCYGYKAQYTGGRCDGVKWRPSIFMPREAARIFLRVTDVRVERLQEISEGDAAKEGLAPAILDGAVFISAKGKFHVLWETINAKRGYGWDTNPWVWVVSFERTEIE